MGSKKKAEEDVICDEHLNAPKKRKINEMIDSLLLEVENKNVAYLKYFVEQDQTGNFPLSEQWRLVFIPALSDTTISDQIFHILKKKYPDIDLMKKEEKTKNPDCIILPQHADTEQLIEVLELVGAACVFYGNLSDRRYGWSCWYKATNLREGNAIPKPTLPQSETQKLAMRKKLEFQTVQELEGLLRQRRTHWATQAIFTCLRISKKCDSFPNRFIVYNVFKFALQGWGDRNVPLPRAFAMSLQLFELFGRTKFFDVLVKNETDLEDVVQSTLTEFFNTLRDPQRIQTELATVLTFDRLMTSLVFSFVYQVKVHKKARTDEIKIKDYTIKSKADKLEEISQLILVILKLLVSIPKSKAEKQQLKSKLALYINIFELKRVSQKPNSLLLRACTSHQGTPNEFKLIKLLLKAGADPNAVDQQRCSPLHLLAKSEHLSSRMWDDPSYSTRAENFTAIVRVIFDGRFHQDQVNLSGQSALECLKPLSSYPDAELSRLVGNFSQGVRPLSCIAAKESTPL
ncbi:protein fem-1 homolog C-like isoform X2 [Daphnia pulicaria]|uniref:protein fem-1 homolog C-like isoform X1 n=1 Tax=Daphnia pulicaria TaxID=35523 RepID=UPI001EEA68C0|nr:protein fem-1 homolog C-like isoform X1 [Daphnia pulicaria]XP_046641965.1 protein fem-1 homolog C-like isoform X2 [Daphnia pulicaria]XP_046641966.1 protein fem-1 homolog C-like isoform X1 [Daphnia pulicaria]XP_046641967.1 protein fem-1 homolog C-like isoform X2 [Daphnia pulicaria]XP_046641968.1 protein fem-1 homolog C-like isoform X1 [Daphnia pulicaria]XP_046641969.1 protein fem-1 homolog C-like isoform X1 [Daphnia pulicaria]XP_046641970.1 protein fem-1 homolog C-like isoform X2 [Daphnia p